MHHMRLVLDMLGCQTDSRHRGIGRYSMNFTRAVAEVLGEADPLFLLGRRNPPDSVRDIVASMGATLPRSRFKTVDLPECENHFETPETALSARMQHAMLAYGYARLNPDVLHVNSLFEWDVDHPAPGKSGALVTSATLYDLIPLLFPKPYLENEAFARCYRHKLETLKKFDLLLAISESAKADAVQHLGLDRDRIVNISGACDEWFTPGEVTPADRASLSERFGISRPFLLYTGNLDFRKNLEGAVRAYAILPAELRRQHCFVLICPAEGANRDRLVSLARQSGLADGEVVLTGQVSDETLLLLYRACRAFVFPSLYEGFGLPVLEAMSCGAPVIAANNSSIPEVIGRADAMFDASDDRSIAESMHRILSDEGYRRDLSETGLVRAGQFTWKRSAQLAVDAWRESVARSRAKPAPVPEGPPRLAFVTPMPPEASGIADYSFELLSFLKKHYRIDVFTSAPISDEGRESADWRLLAADTFPACAETYDRIIYQVGNSPFHSAMLDWMTCWPGTTVLHDFFLSSLANFEQSVQGRANYFYANLLASHGAESLHGVPGSDHKAAVREWPVSRAIFENAEGVIVHSAHLLELISRHYPEGVSTPVAVIPHLRESRLPTPAARVAARRKLGIGESEIVISTFGHIAHTKCPELLMEAFDLLMRTPALRDRVRLVLVGEPEGGEFGASFRRSVSAHRMSDRIKITGFATREAYEDWLAASDIAVQLRRQSRGETSGAVLDCFAFGLPAVINRYAGFCDYTDEVVTFVGEEPGAGELADALSKLISDSVTRRRQAECATQWLEDRHHPEVIARSYAEAVEGFYARGEARNPVRLLGHLGASFTTGSGCDSFLRSLAESAPLLRQSRLYYDITQFKEEWNRGYMTGIQRVVANLLEQLRMMGRPVWPVEVNAAGDGFNFVAMDAGNKWRSTGLRVRYQRGDQFLLPEVRGDLPPTRAFWNPLKRAGVEIHVILYDLLPVRLPQYFPDYAEACHRQFLESLVLHADGVHAISRAMADELADWARASKLLSSRSSPLKISHFLMGANFEKQTGAEEAPSLPVFEGDSPVFLIVGTVEPRKGHAFTLDAFERYWKNGGTARLCVIGRIGWNMNAFEARLRNHPEAGRKLWFLEGVSDGVLRYAYRHACALINASAGEGFGLPLIEAAHHGIPILATDIPVFREVCGDSALYFTRREPVALTDAIEDFLVRQKSDRIPDSSKIPVYTWRDAADSLLAGVEGRTHITLAPESSL